MTTTRFGIRKKQTYIDTSKVETSQLKGRYKDNLELMYSLRSLDLFAPWVNHIYIVTDQQKPTWINNNPRVTIIDHKDIIPEEYLPTFNSSVIEIFLHKIENLSSHYLYLNDDILFGRSVSKHDFFDKNNNPYAFITKMIPRSKKRRNIDYHQRSIITAREEVRLSHFKTIKHKFRHSVKAYDKARVEVVFNRYQTYLLNAVIDKFRLTPINIDYLYLYHELAENKILTRYIRSIKNKPVWLLKNRTYLYINTKNEHLLRNMDTLRPFMVCINEVNAESSLKSLFESSKLATKSSFEF